MSVEEEAAGYILRISRKKWVEQVFERTNITLELKEDESRDKPCCLFIKH